MHDTLITIEEQQVEQQQQVEVHAADEPCTAELAECTCPDFCERDHDNE